MQFIVTCLSALCHVTSRLIGRMNGTEPQCFHLAQNEVEIDSRQIIPVRNARCRVGPGPHRLPRPPVHYRKWPHSCSPTTRLVSSARARWFLHGAALRGPRHGGANEVAIEIALRYKDAAAAESDIRARVASGEIIIGFGHPVYTIADPRSPIIKEIARGLCADGGAPGLF